MSEGSRADGFTEAAYRKILRTMARTWTFVRFPEARDTGRACLWRHDVDCSMHRARALAVMEQAEGVRATYFVHFHSCFYNALEPEITALIREIAGLGHDIGLHFDPAYSSAAGDLRQHLRLERELLQAVTGASVETFSFHNPDVGGWMDLDDDVIEGMTNAYGRSIKARFAYISDSNGHWRFRDLGQVVRDGQDERLHVLTHPEWWTPEPLSPRERITRCIDGRAARQHALYDETLRRMGRPNVR